MEDLPKIAAEAVKKINSKLECSICLDNYKEPKLLPCFHIFCKSPCLERLVVHGLQEKYLICPTCRHHVTLPDRGVAALQTDFHIEHLFEIKQALEKAKKGNQCQICNSECITTRNFCHHCNKTMCENCTEMHDVEGGDRDTVIVDMNSVDKIVSTPSKPVATCQKHSKEQAKFYCETCSELICSECTVRIHKDHNFNLVDDVLLECKEELVSGLNPLRDQQKVVQQALDAYDVTSQEVRDRKTCIESSISLKVDQLHRLLDQRKATLFETLDSKTQQKLDDLATQRSDVEIVHSKISGCVEYTESCLETGVISEIVTMKEPILKQIEQITADFNPSTILPTTRADIELLNMDTANEACQLLGEIVSDPVCADNSFATGNGTSFAITNKPMSVRVHLATAQNNKCEERVDIQAELVYSKSRASVRCTVKHDNGQCRIHYTPVVRGKHSLHIKIRKDHIRGSPYPIAVTPSLESLYRPNKVVRGLSKPFGMATNSNGQVITLERFEHKHCVTVITLTRKDKQFSFGTRGTKSSQFNYPRAIAVDLDDNIYVADKDNHRIQKFTSEGKFVAAVGSRGNNNLQFSSPTGITFDRVANELFVCDQLNHRIHVITRDLQFVRNFGSEGEENGQFKSPMSASFDEGNNLYVTDFGNNRVQVFTAEGQFVTAFSSKAKGEKLQQPYAIAIDSSNIVYVSEWERNSISLFTPEGKLVMSFGESGSEEGQFNQIRGLHVDQHDSIFVSDFKNNRIQIY